MLLFWEKNGTLGIGGVCSLTGSKKIVALELNVVKSTQISDCIVKLDMESSV